MSEWELAMNVSEDDEKSTRRKISQEEAEQMQQALREAEDFELAKSLQLAIDIDVDEARNHHNFTPSSTNVNIGHHSSFSDSALSGFAAKSRAISIEPRPYHSPSRSLEQEPNALEPMNSFSDDPYLSHEERWASRRKSNSSGNFRLQQPRKNNHSSSFSDSVKSNNFDALQTYGDNQVQSPNSVTSNDDRHLEKKDSAAKIRKGKNKKEAEKKRRMEKKASKHRTMVRQQVRSSKEGEYWAKSPPSEVRNAMMINRDISENSFSTATSSNESVMAAIFQVSEVLPPGKKKLILSNKSLTTETIPLDEICSPPLGEDLHKLSLARNQLFSVPKEIINSLHGLRTLDLSFCELKGLPTHWNLPNLQSLYLNKNCLEYFPDETILLGIPSLTLLDLYGNQIEQIILPDHVQVMTNLETLDIGFNNLETLPENINMLHSLKHLKAMNNLLTTIPRSICEINLKKIDVGCNPLFEPPLETCDRGIDSIRRYYRAIKQEEMNEYGTKEKKSKKTQTRRAARLLMGKGRRSKSYQEQEQSDGRAIKDLVVERPPSMHAEPTVAFPVRVEQPNLSSSTVSDEVASKAMHRIVSWSSISGETDGACFDEHEIAVNDTLKVNFVGMSKAGKSSIISRLVYGKSKALPEDDDRTIGVEINYWDPQQMGDKEMGSKPIDTQVIIDEIDSLNLKENVDVNVKFSLWDFAGQHVYHATHELFFSRLALYVIVWDMGTKNSKFVRKEIDTSEFSMYDDSDEEDCIDFEEAEAALKEDVDKNVQFWVDCIQSSAPGAVILPIGSFDDKLDEKEAKRRCDFMKKRLLHHEKKRVSAITRRLQKYNSDDGGNSEEADRLRILESDAYRPKLILGDRFGDVVRISSTEYTGFHDLKEKIIQIATGHERGRWKPALFSGHIGARIPRMRLEVKDLVKKMRNEKKHRVVDLDHFYFELRNKNISNQEDINDALHFLSNVGELVFFGESNKVHYDTKRNEQKCLHWNMMGDFVEHDSDIEEENTKANDYEPQVEIFSENDSCRNSHESHTLSQYIFLNPRWLVLAINCILRHNLMSTLEKLHRNMENTGNRLYHKKESSGQFDDVENPVITYEDVCLLWQNEKKVQKEVVKMKQSYSGTRDVSPYDFLQNLLTRFRVFVPIELQEKTTTKFDDKEYKNHDTTSKSFFLPSLLEDKEPDSNFFRYKQRNTQVCKRTLCHSWLFSECFPPGIVERIVASVLSYIYTVSDDGSPALASPKEQLFWRTAFYLKLDEIEVCLRVCDKDAPHSVASDKMEPGTKRLCVSGQGNSNDDGQNIWHGGYGSVIKAVQHVLKEYPGLEYEEQVICPDCLQVLPVTEAKCWDWTKVRSFASADEAEMICKHGHRVETPLLSGHLSSSSTNLERETRIAKESGGNDVDKAKVENLLRSFVLVAVYDAKEKRVVGAGSGFVADKKHGLIVTAAHTVMKISGKNHFGESCLGLKKGQLIIGVIPPGNTSPTGTIDSVQPAVFRYFAQIVEKHPLVDSQRVCVVDACVLRITARLEHDVAYTDTLENICEIHQRPMLSTSAQNEDIEELPMRVEHCEVEESVRIVGFNQGGDGITEAGEILYRNLYVATGSVACPNFVSTIKMSDISEYSFQPLREVWLKCESIAGESGGPSINRQGQVVGILSRGWDTDDCFLVPAKECYDLVKRYKKKRKQVSLVRKYR